MKSPSPNYQIGDVTPIPEDADRVQAHIIKTRRGMLARNAKAANSNNQHIAAAKKIIAGLEENERRRTDPFEQARTFLRQRGFTPVCFVDKVHIVGRQRFTTKAEVMDFARGKGWKGWKV